MSMTLKSKTLHFAAQVLDLGRNLQQLGQSQAASRILSRLSSFRELPNEVAAETHRRLGELHLKGERFQKARRQLAAALALEPDNAHYHYLMAGAVEEDEAGDARQGLLHYRRCVKLDPENAEYSCALGLYALGIGETDEGLKALRRTAELAPDNPDIFGKVINALREEGACEEAKRLLQAALFRNPRNHGFRALWTHHQFQLLRTDQQDSEPPTEPTKKRGPVLLPFTRPVPENSPDGKKHLRHDLPSGTPGPKLPIRRRLSGKK